MKHTFTFLSKTLCLLILLAITMSSKAQTTVLMTFKNFVQTTANTFEYEVYITNTGTTSLKLRGYSWGLNLTTGIANGGTITHSFVNRDMAFANLQPVVASYTGGTYNHLRVSTVNAVIGNEVALTPGVMYKLARMRVKTSATSWIHNSNPFLPPSGLSPVQMSTMAVRTRCMVNCIITPPGSIYQITAGPASTGVLNGLNYTMIPSPTGSAPFLLHSSVGSSSTTSIPIFPRLQSTSAHEELKASMYPNPNNGVFTLELNKDAKVMIYNNVGELVLEKGIQAGTSEINIQDQPAGLYLVKVFVDDKVETLRFIKQ